LHSLSGGEKEEPKLPEGGADGQDGILSRESREISVLPAVASAHQSGLRGIGLWESYRHRNRVPVNPDRGDQGKLGSRFSSSHHPGILGDATFLQQQEHHEQAQ